MSADQELNKIKQQVHILTDQYKPGTIGQQAGGIIIGAAERLCDKIEFWKKNHGFEVARGDHAEREIERLKSELESVKKESLQWLNAYTNAHKDMSRLYSRIMPHYKFQADPQRTTTHVHICRCGAKLWICSSGRLDLPETIAESLNLWPREMDEFYCPKCAISIKTNGKLIGTYYAKGAK